MSWKPTDDERATNDARHVADRRRRTRRHVATLLLAAAALGAACSDDLVIETTGGDRSWLFAIQSDGDSTFDDTTSMLSMPTAEVLAFTDRPYRDTRTASPQSFALLWAIDGDDSFTVDPPNAVLTYWAGDPAEPRSVVCEVVGDVGYDATTGRLSMAIDILAPADAVLPAVLSHASLFVDDVVSSCTHAPSDEDVIEYFNMLSFQEVFEITTTLVDGEVVARLSCDAGLPAPDGFDLRLSTLDQSADSACDDPAGLVLGPESCIAGSGCTLMVVLRNSTGGDEILSQTEVRVPMRAATMIPELEPATLPICSQTLNPCLLNGDCSLSSTKSGSIQLIP